VIHESSLYNYNKEFLILSPFGGGSLKGGGGSGQFLGYTIFLTLSTLPLRVLPPKGDKNTSYKIQSTRLRHSVPPPPKEDNYYPIYDISLVMYIIPFVDDYLISYKLYTK
jgi:hypothetical protein